MARAAWFTDLRLVLEDDELHMLSIIQKDVQLQVRCGRQIGRTFTTNIGVPQGDSLSPLLFTLYLAQALKPPNKQQHINEHSYTKPQIATEDLLPKCQLDHAYSMPAENYLDINQQYDISYVTTAKHKNEQHKKLVPQIIKRRKLNVNTDKIEENEVERNGNEDWKKCKLVGSLIDTTTDITTGTDLTIAAYNKLKKILERRRVSIKMKIKVKNTYIKNIFLYNSEIWSVTK